MRSSLGGYFSVEEYKTVWKDSSDHEMHFRHSILVSQFSNTFFVSTAENLGRTSAWTNSSAAAFMTIKSIGHGRRKASDGAYG